VVVRAESAELLRVVVVVARLLVAVDPEERRPYSTVEARELRELELDRRLRAGLTDLDERPTLERLLRLGERETLERLLRLGERETLERLLRLGERETLERPEERLGERPTELLERETELDEREPARPRWAVA